MIKLNEIMQYKSIDEEKLNYILDSYKLKLGAMG